MKSPLNAIQIFHQITDITQLMNVSKDQVHITQLVSHYTVCWLDRGTHTG